MSNSSALEEECRRLNEAIGRCIMAWALVEFQLALIWRDTSCADPLVADSIWGRVRSFEAKAQILNDVCSHAFAEHLKEDWLLLSEKTLTLYRKRNQVAHSTMLIVGGKPVLEPFFAFKIGKPNHLTLADVDAFTLDFGELARCLEWMFARWLAATRHQQYQQPEPDLILQLRTKDAQKREEQRLRAQSWRQFQGRQKNSS